MREVQAQLEVLVRQLHCKVGGLVLVLQILITDAVEGARTPDRAHANRVPKFGRLHSGLHAQGEHLGDGHARDEARQVVHELGGVARADFADVHHLVADRIEQRLAAIEHFAVATDVNGELSGIGARRAAADGGVEQVQALLLEALVDIPDDGG